jgi:hypothetical protein
MPTTTVNALGTTNPIQILYGGTNATTASNALTNLGALPIAGGTMTGNLILNADPTTALGAVTKQYADAIAGGLIVKSPCFAGSTTTLNATYANGSSGVGATLTNAGTLAAFTIDGTTPALNARILVKNQSTTFQNGIYSLTTVGSGAVAWVLTRTTDYDTTAQIVPGTFIIVQTGTINTNSGWIETATVTAIGTDPILFSQFGNPGTVTSVSGTTGQIDVANGSSAAVVSIDAGYIGQTSITTLGTIATGTWNGTTVTVPHGGTGNTTFTAYSVLCAGTTATGIFQNVTGVGTTGQVLTSNGASTLPSWQTVTGTGTVTNVTGTAGQISVATGTTTPVISIDATYVGQTSITTLGTIATGTWNGTTITVPHGGTGNTTFTAYSLICAGTTATGIFQNVTGVGTTGQVLTSNGASALPSWQALPATGTVTSVTGTAGQISVATGTTTPVISIDATYVGQTSITTLGTIATGTWNGTTIIVPHGGTGLSTTIPYSIICGGTTTTGNLQSVATLGTAGQILTSTGASSLPVWSSSVGTPWIDQTSSSITMSINTSYVADNVGLITFTLPSTAAFGSTFQITGKGSGGWKIAQATGQQINFGNLATTSGTGGFLQSTNQFDCVTLVCVTTNTQFVVYDCIGNITVN